MIVVRFIRLLSVVILLITAFFSSAFVLPLSEVSLKSLLKNPAGLFDAHISALYHDCNLKFYGLDKQVFRKGMVGFYNIAAKNSEVRSVITIIDFTRPSIEKRLWVIDLSAKQVLYNTLVAHGKNSGENMPVSFSNMPNSYMSSLGFYLTKDTYQGKHGLSLILEGLDKNVNHNAKDRSIVMHGADYVSAEFIKCNGRLGRSQGCPAVPVDKHKQIITSIQGGSVLFIHHPHKAYCSALLDNTSAEKAFCLKNPGYN